MTDSVYLSLDKKRFEETKAEAEKTAKKNGDVESYTWENLNFCFDNNDIEFDEEKNMLYVGGNLKDGELIDLAYASFDIQLPLDTVIEIIEAYRKKLGKLKTVLEATK